MPVRLPDLSESDLEIRKGLGGLNRPALSVMDIAVELSCHLGHEAIDRFGATLHDQLDTAIGKILNVTFYRIASCN